MGYYKDLTPEEAQKVTSAYVGLKINSRGKGVSQSQAMGAFAQATGKPYTMEYARNPAVTMLLKLVKPGKRI